MMTRSKSRRYLGRTILGLFFLAELFSLSFFLFFPLGKKRKNELMQKEFFSEKE